ncbi:MAG: phosphate regulon sensor histidine kinase PhoR [Betaproteobacteria bacterium RIFCSPLOWO2_02_64_14]|nr:MAG: phosphate regulon sensor histidine kinase PhoR [Betaproteobacteria bacterium RIFCSPLOWO2_02_64_14]
MEPLVLRTLLVLLAAATASLAVSALLGAGSGWAVFACVVVVLLSHHLRQLRALRAWLQGADRGAVPEDDGLWGDVFEALYRRERDAAQREQELALTLTRFRETVQAFPDGVVVLDAANQIVWGNVAAERHFDLDFSTDAGHPIANLVRQPDFVSYLASGDYARRLRLRLPRGETTLSVTLIPFGESQKLLHSRDVTQAERVEAVRRDFVANVSHELRTPLTVLVGFLETVRELKLDPSQRRDYINLMETQALRMRRIVEDLLTLSALESAPPAPTDERIVISRLLERMRAETDVLSAGRHQVVLEVRGQFDLLGAESEIASAFSNLASNAVRYTPKGGEVRLIWEATEQGAALTVADTGIGIQPEHIPRLTERFYRVDRSRSRETGGTGLGLAIVKHALTRHDATLEIESTPGAGSRFIARFPAQRLVPAAPMPATAVADGDSQLMRNEAG